MSDLFDWHKRYPNQPGFSNPSTSRDAAAKIAAHVSKLAADVLEFIRIFGGATCWEIETKLQMSHQTASARIRELVMKGFLRETPQRRLTGSGRKAIVWDRIK